jgi:hypothetical protein
MFFEIKNKIIPYKLGLLLDLNKKMSEYIHGKIHKKIY